MFDKMLVEHASELMFSLNIFYSEKGMIFPCNKFKCANRFGYKAKL